MEAARQIKNCPTVGTLNVVLTGSGLANPTKVWLGSGNISCNVISSSDESLSCSVDASDLWGEGDSENRVGHAIQVFDASGLNSFDERQAEHGVAKLFFADPSISAIDGDKTVGGEKVLTVTGSGFGPRNSVISITVGGVSSATVTWISDNEITFLSPPLSGSVPGSKPEVVLQAGGLRSVFTTFSYAAPTLIAASVLDQGATQRLILTGTDFGTQSLPISRVSITGKKAGVPDISCTDIQRTSMTSLTCKYPLGGQPGCSDTKLFVTVAGQETAETDVQRIF